MYNCPFPPVVSKRKAALSAARPKWRQLSTQTDNLSVASGPGENLTPPDPSDTGLIPAQFDSPADDLDQAFDDDAALTLRSWVDSETKRLDAGRPEVLLYQSTREQQIHKLWMSEQWESAIDLATAEIKALGIEKAQARVHTDQRFFDLLKIPYLTCRAQDEMRMGRFENALKSIDMIFDIESNIPVPQHYVLKSTALTALGRLDEAWSFTEQALKYGSEDRDTLEHASILMEARGDWKRLIEVTDKLTEIYEPMINGMSPDQLADLALRRAHAFDGLSEWDECRNAADNAVNNRPTDLTAYMLRGKAEAKLGLTSDALQTYSEVLRRWKSHPGAFNARAEVLLQAGRFEDAVVPATNAINVSVAFYNPSMSRAELESALETIGLESISGSASEADLRSELADYQKSYQLEGYTLLARANLGLKNNKAALEAVNNALKVDPTSPDLKDLKMKIQDAIITQSS